LSRDLYGISLEKPPILWALETDPILVETKMIVEAWDAAGLYQVGWFVESSAHVSEWNGPFRDDVRRFVKGDPGMVSRLADRILGSPDIYTRPDYQTHRSINFVTCHDGFTLNDLVSYNQKHNEANLEDSRDGANDNFSWNCGEEGPTHDPAVEALRLQQIKNFLTILLVSQGTPMLLMGDEVRRSQLGNNNAYCQNNELSWFDWSGLEKNSDYLHFVKGLIDFTQSLEIFQQQRLLEVTYGSWKAHIVWHGVHLGQPDWGDNSHSLAFTLRCPSHAEHLHVMLNAYWEPLTFEVPPLGDGESWHRIVDTALPTPEDFCDREAAPIIEGDRYRTQAHSSVVLMARAKEGVVL
jgi:glycogen operon protein